jgi:PadR family transcriptional regulator, regulatory protein PadR
MSRSQLLKGTTSLLVLGVLREGELYGYEIASRIRERSGSFIDPGEGWLYPALHRLETAGALEASWRESGIGPRRRYYRLTQTGMRMLDAEAREWESFARSVRLVAGGTADA